MRLVLSSVLFIASAFAQTTGQICYAPDKTAPAKSVCQDVTPQVKAALASFIATQTVQTGTNPDGSATTASKYNGIGHLLFSHLADGLFLELLTRFPSAPTQADLTVIQTRQAAIDGRRAALTAKTTAADPQ